MSSVLREGKRRLARHLNPFNVLTVSFTASRPTGQWVRVTRQGRWMSGFEALQDGEFAQERCRS